MQYMLLIYGDEAGWDGATEEQRQAMYAEYGALSRTSATRVGTSAATSSPRPRRRRPSASATARRS